MTLVLVENHYFFLNVYIQSLPSELPMRQMFAECLWLEFVFTELYPSLFAGFVDHASISLRVIALQSVIVCDIIG